MSHDPLALVGRHRRRLWLLIAGFHLGGLLLGGGAFLLGIRVITLGDGQTVPAFAVLGALFVAFGVLVLLRMRPTPTPPPEDAGLPVDQAAEPRLVASVRRAAEKAGARLPLDVVVTPGAGASCLETGALLGAGRRCRVEIGMVQLQGSSAGQLEALLSMHLAHQAAGDLRLRRELARALRTIEPAKQKPSAELPAPLRWCRARLVEAWQRYEAVNVHAMDAAAARACGGRRYAEALKRSTILDSLFEQFLAEEVQPILDEACVPADLYAGFRMCMEALVETGQLHAIEKDAVAEESEGSFPALGARLAFLRGLALPVQAHAEPDLPARALLRDASTLEQRCAARWVGGVEGARPIEWSDVAEQVWAVRFRSAAAALRAALPAGTSLAFVIDWLAGPSQLALAAAAWPRLLDGTGGDEQRQERARALVQRAVAGWIGEELVARGWRWDTSPGYAVELESPAGERMAPLALLAPLGEDPDAANVVRERLGELGLGMRALAAPRERTGSYLH